MGDDVLAQDGEEPRVEPAHAFFACEAREAGDEPRGIVALGDEADAGGF